MLGHNLHVVSCTLEDSYLRVVRYYIFIFVMSMHIQGPNSIFIKTDSFMGNFKWNPILALGQYFPMATLETMGWVTCFVLEHVFNKFTEVISPHITSSISYNGISAITACGGAVFPSNGKAIAAASSSKSFSSDMLWSSKSLGLMKLGLQYRIRVSYWEKNFE